MPFSGLELELFGILLFKALPIFMHSQAQQLTLHQIILH